MARYAGARHQDALILRVLTAAVGLPIVIGAIWAGGAILFAFGSLAALLGMVEVRRLAGRFGTVLWPFSGLGVLAFMFTASRGDFMPAAVFVAVAAAGFLWQGVRWAIPHGSSAGLRSWAVTVGAALYPGALLSFGLALRGLDGGREWLLATVLLIFASDTGAYFVGRARGRHRMAPRISPGKTWEGAIGGLLGAAVVGVALSVALSLSVEYSAAVAIGLGVSVLAQAGDLAESYLKRRGGAKEAGGLLPGHGGILDRLDSVVVVLPAVYYGLIWGS